MLGIYKVIILCDNTRFKAAFMEEETMEVTYNKRWKILIGKDMKKKDLQAEAGISWASVTKLSKGETVSMEVLNEGLQDARM